MKDKEIKRYDTVIHILYALNFLIIFLLFFVIWVIAYHPEYITIVSKFLKE